MARGLIAQKIGMTSLFSDKGLLVPVTILQAEKNRVLQVKKRDSDGYEAVQLGCEPVPGKRLTKPERSRQKGCEKPYRILREFRDFGECELGQEFDLSIFNADSALLVQGISKGKGFQGVMKRHGFSGGRASHGSGFHRSPGSLNASAYPSRVFKGKKLPGRMGAKKVTLRNVKVAAVDVAQGLLFVKGALPGPRKSYLSVELMG